MQAFCGIDHPIAGAVLAKRVHRSGAIIRRSDYGRLGLEFEIAVRIKSDVPLKSGRLTADLIEPHIDGICAAIELVDDRNADHRMCLGTRTSITLYARALDLHLEGVVAKRLASPYRAGERSHDWLKVKRPGAVPPERFARGQARAPETRKAP